MALFKVFNNAFNTIFAITPYTMLTGLTIGASVGSYNYQSQYDPDHPNYNKYKKYKNEVYIPELIIACATTGMSGLILGTLPFSIPITMSVLVGQYINKYHKP